MKILKKMVAVLLTGILAVSSTACGGRNLHAKKLNIDTAVSINIWYQDDKYTQYLDYIAKQFHKANEFVTVNPVKIEENNLLKAIYEGSVEQDNIADVYLMEASDIERAYLMGLTAENDTYTEYYSEKHFAASAISAACFGEKLYGYPVTFHTAVMVYNKKYVSEPEDFEHIQSDINAYGMEKDTTVKSVVGWDTTDLWINYAFGGSYVDNGGMHGEENYSEIQTEPLKASMIQYALYKNKYVFEDKSQQEYIEMFANDEILYTIIDSRYLSELNKADSDYGICAVPKAMTGFGTQSLSDTTLAMVNPYSLYADTAKAVAQAISYDYADLLETYTGFVSARTDVADKKSRELYQPLYDAYAQSDIYAKYIGADEFYLRYSILLHTVWEGKDLDEAVEEFVNAVKN